MSSRKYRIIFPLSRIKWLEIETQVHYSTCSGSNQVIKYEDGMVVSEHTDLAQLPEELFNTFREVYEACDRMFRKTHTFLVSTVTGFQLLRDSQIGYFEYRKEQKQWCVVLEDGRQLVLKRSTRAEDILQLCSTFFQISQQQIVNLDYLTGIEDNKCLLGAPFDNSSKSFSITKTYLKNLQARISQI